MTSKASIEVFSTCPYSSAVERERFLPYVVDVARWSEQAGCRGILVYTDNSTVDPWLVSQIIIQSTEALCRSWRFSLFICTHIPSPRWSPPWAIYTDGAST